MESLTVEETPSAFEDYSIICNLPTEILNHIFAFLQAEDRKSVRLVCKLWYNYSTCSQIQRKEKFVFGIQSSIEDITKVLLKSHYSILNLEFQGLPVNSLPVDFWKEYGNRIHSLEFHQCQWEDQTIENVILHCVNLTSLTFRTFAAKKDSHLRRKDILCSPQLLDNIVEKGIQRPKLQTFIAFINDPFIEMIVNKILQVYPCIRHFAARTISQNWIFHFPNSLKSIEFFHVFPFESIPDDEEESIVIEGFIAKAKQGLRLKHFNGLFRNMENFFKKEKLWDFFSLQKDLNTIKLVLLPLEPRLLLVDDTYNKKLFFHILNSCPSLQEFSFECIYPRHYIAFEWRECPQFLNSISKLQSLRLFVRICSDDPSISSEPLLPPILTPSKNLVLTTLELRLSIDDYGKEQDYLCAALFQHCPLLVHLKICNCSDFTLSIIFKYLLKLQTLILAYTNYKSCNKYGLTGHDASNIECYSIKRLQQLKHLSISCDIWSYIKPLTEKILLEIQLPHLEFLEFNIDFLFSLEEELINCISSQIPKLRFLSLIRDTRLTSRRTKPNCKVLQFFMCLKNLNCIEINLLDIYYDLPNLIEDIFRVCPSVRYVLDHHRHVFFFDPLTNKIQNEGVHKFKFKTKVPDFLSSAYIMI